MITSLLFGSRTLRFYDYWLLSKIYGKTLSVPEQKEKGIVLTFDVETWEEKCGGSSNTSANPEEEYLRYLPTLLDTLDNYGVRAQFFVCGKVMETYSDAFLAVVKRGHGVGGHGYSHEIMSTLSRARQSDIVERVGSLISKNLGIKMKSWRCPWLAANIQTYQALRELDVRCTSNNRTNFLTLEGVLDIPSGKLLDGELLGWQSSRVGDRNAWLRHMKYETSSRNGIIVFTMHTWIQKKFDPKCEELSQFFDFLKSMENKVWLGSLDDLMSNLTIQES